MVAQPIPVEPGLFRAEREELAQVLDIAEKIRPVTERVSVPTDAGGPSEPARTRQMKATDTIPVQCLLTVDGGGDRVSLTLPLRSIPIAPPDVYELQTLGTVKGLKVTLRVSATGQGNLELQTNYIGLDASRALSYARFVDALKREDGRFTVSA